MFFNFLWNGKREKIKRKTLIGRKEQGGLNMVDVNTFIKSIKINWIKALMQKDEANWKIIPSYLLDQYGENLLILNMNTTSLKKNPDPKFKLTPFYKNILDTWFEFKSTDTTCTTLPTDFHTIRQQLLWGNKHIQFKGKGIIFKSWIESGILFVNDIIHPSSGKIDEHIILDKLKNKSNWISQINIIKNVIPRIWKIALNSNASTKTYVKTTLEIKINHLCVLNLCNKDFYSIMVRKIFIKPYIHRKWENMFNQTIDWDSLYCGWERTCF